MSTCIARCTGNMELDLCRTIHGWEFHVCYDLAIIHDILTLSRTDASVMI